MGSGCWSAKSYTTYCSSVGRSYDAVNCCVADSFGSAQEVYHSRTIQTELDPKKIVRECCDSKEHPETFPVILGLDVTGSMGDSAIEVSKKLNILMTESYKTVKDVEFAVMAIGDLSYDRAPIQMSQFESDVRIAENLDKIYFEAGGGGNSFESYTAAWYMGLQHAKLDCWKRGKKGLIITLGDEQINPYLPHRPLSEVTGDKLQGDVETTDLYKAASAKYDIYHIIVKHDDLYGSSSRYWADCEESFAKVIGKDHVITSSVNGVVGVLNKIIASSVGSASPCVQSDGLISW